MKNVDWRKQNWAFCAVNNVLRFAVLCIRFSLVSLTLWWTNAKFEDNQQQTSVSVTIICTAVMESLATCLSYTCHVDFSNGVMASDCVEHSGVWREHFKVLSRLFLIGAWWVCGGGGEGGTSLCANKMWCRFLYLPNCRNRNSSYVHHEASTDVCSDGAV
jgi:hypothetical protein